MTCQDSFHEVAFNISFWTRNISSARILFWRGVSRMVLDARKADRTPVENLTTTNPSFVLILIRADLVLVQG